MASPGHNINLNDPAVRRLMGTDQRGLATGKANHNGRELVQIGGDPVAEGPVGMPTGWSQEVGPRGAASTIRMTESALGHPRVFYTGKFGEYVLEGDLYAFPGEPMKLVLICPVCTVASGKDHGITITSDAKAIEYDPRSGPADWGGRLSVETFECTWELEGHKQSDRNQNINIVMGANLCRWRVAIDNNIARDA